MKSVLVDYLVSAGLKPTSIVSYNHLGNNDGRNLSEPEQFRSKEITKTNVVDDMVESNRILYPLQPTAASTVAAAAGGGNGKSDGQSVGSTNGHSHSGSVSHGEGEVVGPDHCVVIKYVPYVGDSKRAMDEYTSEIFLGKEVSGVCEYQYVCVCYLFICTMLTGCECD